MVGKKERYEPERDKEDKADRIRAEHLDK